MEFSSSISGRRGSAGSLPASGSGDRECDLVNSTSSIVFIGVFLSKFGISPTAPVLGRRSISLIAVKVVEGANGGQNDLQRKVGEGARLSMTRGDTFSRGRSWHESDRWRPCAGWFAACCCQRLEPLPSVFVLLSCLTTALGPTTPSIIPSATSNSHKRRLNLTTAS